MITIYTRPGVSMHLLVLSAFRHDHRQPGNHSQDPVSMHLLVLSAFRQDKFDGACRFGGCAVSMHLLVLSAFRRQRRGSPRGYSQCLNAPSGAQCFPTFSPPHRRRWRSANVSQCTFWCSVLSDLQAKLLLTPFRMLRLNAPSGAQCFPTRKELLK